MRRVSVTSTSRAKECASSADNFGGSTAPPAVMAGLVPAIHDLSEGVIQVEPLWVVCVDEPDLPGATPVLDVLLALNRTSDVVECLEVNEGLQTVALREACDSSDTMFVNTGRD